MKILCLFFSVFVTLSASVSADWRQFRGTDSTGVVAADPKLPVALSEENIAWKKPLPGRGVSSPIVVGERVFVTCSSGPNQDRLHVLCFSNADGALMWERQFWATGRTMAHEKTCVAAPTPASDGERVFALFSSNDLICVDLDGNLQWLRGLTQDYPNASNSLGLASSPVVVGDTLVVQIENDSQSFAAGVDTSTGLNRWREDRTKRANWSSPIVFGDRVVMQGSKGIDVISPADGGILWHFGEGASTIPSPASAGEVLYIPSNGITAVAYDTSNKSVKQKWTEGSLRPATASPVVAGGRVYVINSASFLNCAEAEDGEKLWKIRLDGPFGATPVVAGEHLYAISERAGLLQVVDLGGEEGELVGELELGEMIQATPAIANSAIFVRSDGHLWKISRP
ncbi:MAG: outer membrane protein assembly factor BamB [Verrucomicrobiales bacterium]|jgi:outer membrane protein assembly factor BamB